MSKHVLFVCSGNTCRSPMAAGLLRRELGGNVDVQSAGIEAAAGVHATKHAIEVMNGAGIDISDHQSRDITSLDLTMFDVIVAMTPVIARRLREIGVGKARIAELDVRDPYGKGIDSYRETFNELNRELSSLAKVIEKGEYQTWTRDPITYLTVAIRRIENGDMASVEGSHAAGIFLRTANRFEKAIKAKVVEAMRSCGLDYDQHIRPAIKGHPDLSTLTLGNCIFALKKVTALKPSEVASIIPAGWTLEHFLQTIGEINNVWKEVKHGEMHRNLV